MTIDLSLPPLYTGIVLGSGDGDARSRARELAAQGADAGTLVWHPDAARVDCAVVLRPDEPGRQVLPVLLVASLALSDAIGSAGPPAIASDLVWPAGVRVNGGRVGGVAVDLDSAELQDTPDWGVVAAFLLISAETDREGGERPDVTCLEAEGFAGVGARELIEAFARHLLVWMDRWEDQGLAPIARHWFHRATARTSETELLLGGEPVTGSIEKLDEAGDLLLQTGDGPRQLTLEAWWRASR